MAMTLDEVNASLSRVRLVRTETSFSGKSFRERVSGGRDVGRKDLRGLFRVRIVLELDGRQKSYFHPDFGKKSPHESVELIAESLTNLLGGRFVIGIKPKIYGAKRTAIYWKAKEIRDAVSRVLSRSMQKVSVQGRVQAVKRQRARSTAAEMVRRVFRDVATDLRRQDVVQIWQEVQDERTVKDVMQS